jgi:hypothetical protein
MTQLVVLVVGAATPTITQALLTARVAVSARAATAVIFRLVQVTLVLGTALVAAVVVLLALEVATLALVVLAHPVLFMWFGSRRGCDLDLHG